MKIHFLGGVLLVLAGAAACNSSREPLAPVARQPQGDRTDGPRKPVHETVDAEKADVEKEKPDARKVPDNASNRAAPLRRQTKAADRDTEKRVTLLWFLLRSPLGG